MQTRVIKFYKQLVPHYDNNMENWSTFFFFLTAPILIVSGLDFVVHDICWLVSPLKDRGNYVPFMSAAVMWIMAGLVLSCSGATERIRATPEPAPTARIAVSCRSGFVIFLLKFVLYFARSFFAVVTMSAFDIWQGF